MRKLIALAACASLSACGLAPATPSLNPAPGAGPSYHVTVFGYTEVPVTDASVRLAARNTIHQLHGPSWLADETAKAGALTKAATLKAFGTTYQLTLPLTIHGKTHDARATIIEDADGVFRLSTLELALVGKPLLSEPEIGLPGGYVVQPNDSELAKQSASYVSIFLSASFWLGKPVVNSSVIYASSKEGAGADKSVFVSMKMRVGGIDRVVGAIIDYNAQGTPTMSWARLSRPSD